MITAEKEKTTSELIMEEFNKAHGKKRKLIEYVADKMNRQPGGIKNNWFYGFGFPKELEDEILNHSKDFNNGS